MEYTETIICKDGRECLLRNGEPQDGALVRQIFDQTHGETDFLLSYPEENSMDEAGESAFLRDMKESSNAVELLAFVDGKLAGTAGIHPVGTKFKVRHRAEFGISIAREFWGNGIGSALMAACIACAKKAGYAQLELDAVADNEKAIAMYRQAGFVEYGRNPKGFYSKYCGDQELVYMRLEL